MLYFVVSGIMSVLSFFLTRKKLSEMFPIFDMIDINTLFIIRFMIGFIIIPMELWLLIQIGYNSVRIYLFKLQNARRENKINKLIESAGNKIFGEDDNL